MRVLRLCACAWLAAALALLLISAGCSAAPVTGTDRTYTADADFDLGSLVNVNHDTPTSNQLQLNKITTPFPFVNIACSGRGTIVRIDVNTGVILGEYLTAPNGMGRDPSRTTVDKLGNVWVANRAESSGGKGSVTRVALVIGGTRCDADGTPNPAGQYLKPPFQYSTAVDRDGDGLIKTSRGLSDVLSWTNAGSADTNGGVSTAEDECIINYTRVNGTNTRTVAIDANNDVWVGGTGNCAHEKISGVTGQPIPGTQFNLGVGGYGGLVDGNGVLWSARGPLVRFDTNTMTGTVLGWDRGDYGLGIDPQTGHIWHTFLYGNQVAELDSAGNVLHVYGHGNYYSQGVAVDGSGNVWVAGSLYSDSVGHLRTDGTFVGNIYVGAGPTGVAVDANGKIWAANIYSNTAVRINPNAGPIGGGGFPVGAVDLTVSLGSGASPYNYSDMTGFVVIGSTSPQGTLNLVQDAGTAGAMWHEIIWNSELEGAEPSGTSIVVEARTADTQPGLTGQPFAPVSNGVEFSLLGRYIEVQATLKSDQQGVSPVLSDIRVVSNHPPDCSNAYPSISKIWPPSSTKLVPVTIKGVTDPDGDPIKITITSIFQDEPTRGQCTGDLSPDGFGIGTNTAKVRAERGTKGNGRVYTISFIAEDPKGGSCTNVVKVCVPRSVFPYYVCVDGGPIYDSTKR